jgi:uncharacterized protein YqeY
LRLARALLRQRIVRVNPQAKIFSCENNRLDQQNPLLAESPSITLETSFLESSGKNRMRETITAALKHATKAQDKRRISTLRLISAAIKDRDIAARTAGKTQATDAELLELFAKMIKQREESEKIYTQAGRAELARQEAEEIAIIREFLPKQLSDQEMEKAITDAIAKAGASSVKDMGKVMAELKAKYAGQMDFGKAGALVKSKLT